MSRFSSRLNGRLPGSIFSRSNGDVLFEHLCLAAATALLAALAGVIVVLLLGSRPAFQEFGLSFLYEVRWNPAAGEFGAGSAIVGTLITALLAMVLALPLAGGVAVFLTEFCPAVWRRPVGVAVELLAGIPSIVYGMWGLFVLAPWFARHVQEPLSQLLPAGSALASWFAAGSSGANISTASLVLTIMIVPYTAAVLRDLLMSVPAAVRESAYAMGATSAEVVWTVTLPFVQRSAIGAVMLGLGRALGETMAVTFMIGHLHAIPQSLFDPATTLASTIANELDNATGALHASALTALGLVLFTITFAVIALARLLIGRRGEIK